MSTLIALTHGRDRVGLPDCRRPLLLVVEARRARAGAGSTGWFNLIGQIAVTAAIGYGLAIFAQVLFDYWFDYRRT